MDFWQVLPAAIALMLILEGMLPFLSPGRWREIIAMAGQMDDRSIRMIGFGSMLCGVLLLYFVQ